MPHVARKNTYEHPRFAGFSYQRSTAYEALLSSGHEARPQAGGFDQAARELSKKRRLGCPEMKSLFAAMDRELAGTCEPEALNEELEEIAKLTSLSTVDAPELDGFAESVRWAYGGSTEHEVQRFLFSAVGAEYGHYWNDARLTTAAVCRIDEIILGGRVGELRSMVWEADALALMNLSANILRGCGHNSSSRRDTSVGQIRPPARLSVPFGDPREERVIDVELCVSGEISINGFLEDSVLKLNGAPPRVTVDGPAAAPMLETIATDGDLTRALRNAFHVALGTDMGMLEGPA